MKINKLPKAGEESLNNSGNIEQAEINQNEIGRESLNQWHDISDKDSNPQAVINNTVKDHPPSTVSSQNKPYVTLNTNTNLVPDGLYIMNDNTHHCYSPQKGKDNSNSNSLHDCGNTAIHNNSLQQLEDVSQCKKAAACKTEESHESDQLSLDSNDKLTETTHVSSASSHISIEEGEYIENKSPTPSVKDDVTFIPLQPHDSHQSIATHFDETFVTTTAMEGEYIDYNTAVQQN